jgi:hypothetical protein
MIVEFEFTMDSLSMQFIDLIRAYIPYRQSAFRIPFGDKHESRSNR